MVDDYMLDKIFDKIKEIIGIEKFADTKIMIDTDDKLPDDINFYIFILLTIVTKDGNKFYLQLFLEHALYLK